ncbi:hypothetical protein HNQ59_003977 [Chitinivorax tropicus]|uniref:Uncharacterized protein n=1 Tax=Chitinivorax tropicus TaxID=714531 RepID=A0A840MV24_9PROT|nr:hypothetical protein [Chitinivorax tropicus]MBB5020652.1 hypothetical protein [Chitinivorax tropicus]
MAEVTKNLVYLEALGEIVEEEIVISCGNTLITCFAGNHPSGIKVGESYSVKLSLVVFDDYEVEELGSDAPENIEKLANGLAYKITGRVSGGFLYSKGVVFENSALESEYAYLDGEMIAISADRIGVKFLPNSK